jgi:hypothetical protein
MPKVVDRIFSESNKFLRDVAERTAEIWAISGGEGSCNGAGTRRQK